MSTAANDLFRSTINEYLDNLPEAVHMQLFRSPETCLAVFRLLPSLAKFYIMTLLFQEKPIPYGDLNRWIKHQKEPANTSGRHRNSNKIYQNESLKRLRALNLLKEIRRTVKHPTTGKNVAIVCVQLNPVFQQSFRDALTGFKNGRPQDENEQISEQIEEVRSRENSDTPEEEGLEEKVGVEFLDNYCLGKWENILHFMVGSDVARYPSMGVLVLLRTSGLMELPSDRRRREIAEEGGMNVDSAADLYVEGTPTEGQLKSLMITRNGFQFLLQDINSQIWTLLLQYLKMSEKLQMNPVDVLNFIFMLGSLELGEGYPVRMLSRTQQVMLQDLVDYGLIYRPEERGQKGAFFYPTRLATSLTSESTNFKNASTVLNEQIAQNKLSDSASNDGKIIIETNFKIYCYTNSPLQIAVLNLFVHMKTRFANMVTGIVTRDSVRRALMNGITADQIVSYLESHAHSGMVKKAEDKYNKKLEFETSIGNAYAADQLKFEVLPPTVVDQIKLWQLELDRIQSFQGYLYKDFANEFEFEKLLNYGDEIGVILWRDKTHRRFFVTTEGNTQLIEYASRILRKGSSSRSATPA